MEMYTTGFIMENTNSNPDSAQQLTEELSDCINNHLQVISDYQTWKMTDEFPPIFEADWRAALSSEQYFEMASRRLSSPVRFSTHFMELLDLYPEVHLFEIYRTVYYQWHGNKLLKEASDRATSTLPRQKQWKLILKQMVNHDVVDRYKLEEMYPDIMKTMSEIVFDELTQKYINRKNLNEDLKKAKEVQSKIEAERRQEAWIETDDDEELVLSDITPLTMQDSTSKKSKYSKESIRKLEISMREQQLQMELRLAETQRQAQMDANRRLEEGFERLITMFAERTPERVTNNRSSREVAQRKRDSLIQSTSMAGTAIDLSLPLSLP